jgi:glycosyltransferase involved in cell wall biosynthesis
VYDSYGAALPTTEARAALGIPADVGGVVLFFGLIRPYKGLDVLLRAVAGAAFQQQKIHVLVAGECYGDEATYTQLADELGLGDRTHFYLQYIANEAVAQFFSAADVVALPYKTATQSGVLQIAYHFNRPVVVTRVGGLPEMVEEGESGFVVPPNDPAAVADVLLRFFAKDPEALQAGVQRVKARFSWENLVRALTGMRNAESGNAE